MAEIHINLMASQLSDTGQSNRRHR